MHRNLPIARSKDLPGPMRKANHSIQRTGACRLAQHLFVAQWLAPAADAGRRWRRLRFERQDMCDDFLGKTRAADAAEAMGWLREARNPKERTISGGDGLETAWFGRKALEIVQRLYDSGAVRVTAVEISGRIEGEKNQDTSTLVVELPEDAAKRDALFRWEADYAMENGWDPATDTGQDCLLIWRD